MAEYAGSALYLKFGSTVLSADHRSFEPNEEIGVVDASAGSDEARSYVTTLKDGRASAELVDQTGGTALWAAVKQGTSGTLEWGPEGTASTKPKHTATAIVLNRRKSIPYDGIVAISIEWQLNTVVTDTVY